MTTRILLPALAALALSLVLSLAPASAQGPAPLPLQGPAERTVDRANRDLQLNRRLGEIERQRAFEDGQLRQRIDRLETFPRLVPPEPAIGAGRP
ncbi:MAG: hypothetical protein ACFE0R_12405 [Salinarimonas sp.]